MVLDGELGILEGKVKEEDLGEQMDKKIKGVSGLVDGNGLKDKETKGAKEAIPECRLPAAGHGRGSGFCSDHG
ncbi:hypothetical protein V6N11_049935 [Hibiscus sabdariffa]|uniref:Uncharacterized protein n=1 Tax=Hibiscus sabdariffa TaxID=183260 RepID=A0ABR2T8D4_9ROSI